MHRTWSDIRNHRPASALFLAWWLALLLLNFIVSRRTQESVGHLHFLPPVIAGALICWWRRFRPERITSGTLAGAIVLVLDVALQLPRELADALAGGRGLWAVLKAFVDVEVLVFAALGCVIGALLGFAGALGAVAFAHLQKESRRAVPDSQSAPDSPSTPTAEPADEASAISSRRIMPRRTLAVAGGLVLVATVILASGTFGRAVPPPTTTVNLLVAVALLAPISRWSGDAGRALALIAGLVSFSLGSAVLAGAGFTWAERSAMLSVALTAGALAELGAGVLALIATFRKPDAHKQRNDKYDLKPVRTPRLRGIALRMAVALLERPAIRSFLAPWLIRNIGLPDLRAAEIDEQPTFLPLHVPAGPVTRVLPGEKPPPQPRECPGFRFRGMADYQAAYREGGVTPEQVAERVLAAIASSERLPHPLRAFVACDEKDLISQAREATLRWKEGRPLGALDGVPIAVKDELDMVPYPTTAGTRFLGGSKAQADATVVARLRAAGALLVGKTNMHEIGILPDGLNAHYGPVRNPYGPAHEAGGSSSGSAAAVAAGMCAAAIGTDGGGSIRVPASYCGVVGLKPTFGRVSEFGAVPLAWSVAHVGPIAATAEDAAQVYAVISGPDPRDLNTRLQPPVRLAGFQSSLHDVRIGIYKEWFSDASSEVVAACEELLRGFVKLGAQLVDVTIPDLRLMAIAHAVTIHTEMAANMERYDREHRRDSGLTTRLMLANVRAVRSSDYVQAQRMRSRAINEFRSALTCSDVIATPTTPIPAPAISAHGLVDAESNIGQVLETMRFVNPANLTGLPAISIPSGYGSGGLPVGLQVTGRPWDENTLLRLAYAAGGIVVRQKPLAYFDLLAETGEWGR